MIGYSDSMRYENIKISQSTSCHRCKMIIRWSDSDEDFGGVLEKLKHHLLNNVECIRDFKLKELLTDDSKS